MTYTFNYDHVKHLTTASLNGTEVAWFTNGAHTVTLRGPERTFEWKNLQTMQSATVRHNTWVRTLDRPYVFQLGREAPYLSAWLDAALGANHTKATQPDILALAFQYDQGSPEIVVNDIVIAKDAGYRLGADFHDFLGKTWDPPDDPPRAADPTMKHMLDCSGFIRMIFGYRKHAPLAQLAAKLPLSVGPYEDADGVVHIPRRARDMAAKGPGRLIIYRAVGAPQPAELDLIRIGDLVFFQTGDPNEAETNEESGAYHMGMFVGTSSHNEDGTMETHYRFISSRKSLGGPTIGDGVAGSTASAWSIFNTTKKHNFYANHFYAARRF